MGIHPKTRAALPTAIEVDPVLPPARSNDGDEERVRPLGFYEYVPEIFPAARPACTALGSSTADRQKAMLERTRAKQLQVCTAPTTPTYAQMGICECDAFVCTCGGAALFGVTRVSAGTESSASYEGRDLGGFVPPMSVPLSTMVMFTMGKAVTASPGLSRLAVRFGTIIA